MSSSTSATATRRWVLKGTWPVLRKEAIHIRRDKAALFFALIIPFLQLFLLGYAVNTNVRNVKTAVFDAAKTQESRELVRRFINTDDFNIIAYVDSDPELNGALVSGRARVGIKIPSDYSRRLLAGQTASVLVLVDGSDSMVTGETSNVSSAVVMQASVDRLLSRGATLSLPIEARRKILFNPDSRSANFFIPGLIVVLVQMITVLLTAFSIVRERERGTLEQLFMTPVSALGLMIGKMIPYGIVAFIELCAVLLAMRFVFLVPIHGSVLLLLLLSIPFILTMLGIGLLISTRAQTQQEAMQMAFGTMLPSIFLSGYIFPIESMPAFFQWVAIIIPARYLMEISRGIILRGAGLADLWQPAAILLAMGTAFVGLSAVRFQKKIS